MKIIPTLVIITISLVFMSCSKNFNNDISESRSANQSTSGNSKDVHSYSNPNEILVKHADLDLEAVFTQKVLKGTCTLTVERHNVNNAPLILDTKNLKIDKVEASTDGTTFANAKFTIGNADKILGAPLTIELPEKIGKVRITYETHPDAYGVQWLTPPQTAGKKHPYLFTQSQAIHARSWLPLQDSPGVRITYAARIRTPQDLRAVMSAEMDRNAPANGEYRFNMPHSIPPYLIALAIGNLGFQSLGDRAGVYTEPVSLDKAALEFSDTQSMISATEKLYGPYRWGRYDLLVLPPSFPIGGMENPKLTFATPTIIAGDKSLVSLVAHELAHSWSGNLVTNATWRDFWLNEGFTTYLERRIVEAVYGREQSEMEAVLGKQELVNEMKSLPTADQILHINLAGRDPDEGFTSIAYEKGALFLRRLEETFGRDKFDNFLKNYFDHFAFQSITTEDFVTYLKQNLLDKDPQLAAKVDINEWLFKPGLPTDTPTPKSAAFDKVDQLSKSFLEGKATANNIPWKKWSTHERLRFLISLSDNLSVKQMSDLDKSLRLTESGNAEVAHQWLLMSIHNKYAAAYPRVEQYLMSIGRQKLIKPLYAELAKTPEGKQRALEIFKNARPGYHPIAQNSIGKILQVNF